MLEVMSIDEAWVDLTQVTYESGGNPRRVAADIKRGICDRLGKFVRVSVGLAPTKTMAKIAGEIDKPNGLVWITKAEVPHWLERLEVDEACGIADRIKARLLKYNIRTLADLGRFPPYKLRHEFGIVGHYLHLIGQGRDVTPINPSVLDTPHKSFGHSRVLRHPLPTFEEARPILKLLCYKVARRMRGAGFQGRMVYFFSAGKDDPGGSKQRALPIATADEQVLYKTCCVIADELNQQGKLPYYLQLIGLSVSKLCRANGQPVPLFEKDRKRISLLGAMDVINDAYGDLTAYCASYHEAKEKIMWNAQNRGMFRDVKI